MIVRGDHLRASNAMKDRVEAHKKVNVIYNSVVEDAYGDGRGLTGLHLLNQQTGGQWTLHMTDVQCCMHADEEERFTWHG